MTNRPLKFRVWNKNKQTLNYEIELTFHQIKGVEGYEIRGTGDEENIGNQDNFIINQFTSLLDKNNKEIYEGDIVKWIIKPLNLRYKEEWEEWEKQGSKMQDYIKIVKYCGAYIEPFNSNAFTSFNHKSCEIIGNIYENPEFLK